MSKSTKLDEPTPTAPESESVPDLASAPPLPIATVWGRLLEAAKKRFPDPEFEVTCDDRHTIWVKRTDGTRSVGISQWLLRRFTLEEILSRTEARLAGKVPR